MPERRNIMYAYQDTKAAIFTLRWSVHSARMRLVKRIMVTATTLDFKINPPNPARHSVSQKYDSATQSTRCVSSLKSLSPWRKHIGLFLFRFPVIHFVPFSILPPSPFLSEASGVVTEREHLDSSVVASPQCLLSHSRKRTRTKTTNLQDYYDG